ncbi:hypothetical protein HDV03_005176 [Kappamyces sp. JEL0829]|nr:hypothetical protein HDV03_005176 [Kappamyces sp. JEL0829]
MQSQSQTPNQRVKKVFKLVKKRDLSTTDLGQTERAVKMKPTAELQPSESIPRHHSKSKDAGGKRGHSSSASSSSAAMDEGHPTDFQNCALDKNLKHALVQSCGFRTMTAVQSLTIESLLKGHDMHILAKTGSGKTAAFLVPSLQKIISNKVRSNLPQLLVISPTRELAMQIAKDCAAYLQLHSHIRVGLTIGGTNMNSEAAKIRAGLEVLVSTPGRLLDHLGSNAGLLSQVQTFVLDECDRLLDMGFAPDINRIIRFVSNHDKQSILCSATTSPAIDKIIKAMLKPDHGFVSTVPPGEANVHEKVPQFFVNAPFDSQLMLLVALLLKENSPTFKAVVFLPTAHLANLYHSACASFPQLRRCLVQHSRQSQSKRLKVSDEFKTAVSAVLFATDVVARGMTYIHRVGRTGRADADGKGVILLDPAEQFLLPRLRAKQIPISELKVVLQQDTERLALQGAQKYLAEEGDGGKKAYQSWLGFYNSRTKDMRMDKVQLVATANQWAMHTLQCRVPPALEKKTVGKMGLKGVAGLCVE